MPSLPTDNVLQAYFVGIPSGMRGLFSFHAHLDNHIAWNENYQLVSFMLITHTDANIILQLSSHNNNFQLIPTLACIMLVTEM